MNRRHFTRGVGVGVITGVLGAKAASASLTTKELGSGGLGLRGSEFRALWGEPSMSYTSGDGDYYFEEFITRVSLRPYRRINGLTLSLPTPDSWAPRADSPLLQHTYEQLLPIDAKLIDQGNHLLGASWQEGTGFIYHSAWLARRYISLETVWQDPEYHAVLGDLVVWLLGPARVERIFISTGRNPYKRYGDNI